MIKTIKTKNTIKWYTNLRYCTFIVLCQELNNIHFLRNTPTAIYRKFEFLYYYIGIPGLINSFKTFVESSWNFFPGGVCNNELRFPLQAFYIIMTNPLLFPVQINYFSLHTGIFSRFDSCCWYPLVWYGTRYRPSQKDSYTVSLLPLFVCESLTVDLSIRKTAII